MPKRKVRHGVSGGDARDPGGRHTRGSPRRLWIYGTHAVAHALRNPRRRVFRLVATKEGAERFHAETAGLGAQVDDGPPLEHLPRESIGALLPAGAIHQGLAAEVEPLEQPDARTVARTLLSAESGARPLIVALDQVSDPQNAGAVLRTSAAFAAGAVLTTERHAPPESGALAKAASGALEHVPYCRVVNLARTLEALKRDGYWVIGLDAGAAEVLPADDGKTPLVLVLGAEGRGLRRLTRETCDRLVRLPTRGAIATLNVSAAAAATLSLIAQASARPGEAGTLKA